MKKFMFKTQVILLFVFSILLWSCEKNSIDSSIEEAADSEESSVTEVLLDDALEQSEVYEDGTLKSGEADYCIPMVTITYPDGTPFPRIITIDFGNDGCTGKNGCVRKGKIISTITGPFHKEGSSRTITFENFYINDFLVLGTRTVTNTGLNEGGNMCWSIEENGKVITPEGNEISRIASRVREWISGSDTKQFFWDDVFAITGTASGINSKGVAYTSVITMPLIKARNCRWIQQGTLVRTKNGKEHVIDYGQGDCDNLATVTVGDKIKEIKLKW